MLVSMRLACVAFVLVAIGQESDRTRFDGLLKQLDDDSIDVREAAAKALADFPAAADAWLKEAAEKAEGERKTRVIAVQTERAVRIETARLLKAGLSKELMQAHRLFAQRLTSDDSEERLSLLEEASGVRLDPKDDDPDRAENFKTASPATPHELSILIGASLQKPASPRLKRQVLAILDNRHYPVLARAARSLLTDGERPVRKWASRYFRQLRADLTFAAADILKLLREGDDEECASDLVWLVDWRACLDDAIGVLPALETTARDRLRREILDEVAERHEPAFRRLLFDKELSQRRLALDYYKTWRAVAPVDELTEILDDPNVELRLMALRALGGKTPKARLLREASSASAEMREAAIDALVASGAPEGVALVKRELKAGHALAPTWAAAIADESMRDEVVACAKRLSNDRALAEYLTSIGDDAAAAETYAHIMKEGPLEGVRSAVHRYVRAAGDEAIDVLIELAQSGDERRRQWAAEGLWQFRTVKAQEALMLLMSKDPSRDVQSYAASSFHGWSGPGASERNWKLVQDPIFRSAFGTCFNSRVCIPDDSQVREALAGSAVTFAVRALLATGSDEARRAVEARIESMTDIEVRRVALSLAYAKAPGARERLLKLPRDPSSRGGVDQALVLLGDEDAAHRFVASCVKENDFRDGDSARFLPAPERDKFFKTGLEAALCSHTSDQASSLHALARAGSDEALDALVDYARRSAEPHRTWELLDLDPARVLPRVRPLAESKEAAERRMAAKLLGAMGGPADRRRLVALLKDPSPLVRAQAAEALGEMGSVQSADAIAALLKDADDNVRADACRALAALGVGPLDALKAACGDPVKRVRREALLARLAQGDPSRADEVADHLKRDLMRFPVDRLEPLAGSPRIAELLRERVKRRFDPFILKLLARAGDKEAIARLKKEGTAPCQGILIELGLHEHPAEALSLLPWALRSDADDLLVPMNRVVDAKRYDGLMKRRTEGRWIGAKASDLAAVLSELWGVTVKVDGSVRDRDQGSTMPASRGLRVVLGAVPVFEGDGITLYSYTRAKEAWEKRLVK